MKKSRIDIIIGKLKPKAEDEEKEIKHESPDEEGLLAASDEILEAIKSEDAMQLKEALYSFFMQCDKDYIDD